MIDRRGGIPGSSPARGATEPQNASELRFLLGRRVLVFAGFTGVFKNRDTDSDSLTGMAHLNFMVNFPDIRVNLRGLVHRVCLQTVPLLLPYTGIGDSTVHLFQLRTSENANMPTCNRLLMSRFSNLFWEMSWLGNVMAHVVVRVG